MNQYNPNPFPVDCFPVQIKNAVLEMQDNTGFPIPLIASSVLGTLSVACQNSINVLPPVGAVSPVSLNILLIADSGEGKTPIDKYCQQPIRDFEENEDRKSELAITQLKGSREIWEIELKAIKTAIRKNREKTVLLEDDAEQIEQLRLYFQKLQIKLQDHLPKEPKHPPKFKLIHSDVTPAKLALNLSENIPSAYLSSDESASLFRGEAMKDLGMYSGSTNSDS